MVDVVAFNSVAGVARERVSGVEQEDTAPWTAEDPRRIRASFLNGRFLTARDLTREQQYALIRQADLCQASGGGVVSGLYVWRGGQGQLRLGQGSGITPAGETVIMRRDASVVVTRMPVAERFGEQPMLRMDQTARVGNRSGLFAVCLRAVEYTDYPATVYPTGVMGKRKIEDGDVREATAVVFVPLAPEGADEAEESAGLRARMARDVFLRGELFELTGTVLPLAVVLLDRGNIVWVDTYLVRRELGADAALGFGITRRSSRVSHWWQYWEHLQDVLRDRSQRGQNFRFAARSHFDALPPFGVLPRQAVEVTGQKLVQWFFPQEMPIDVDDGPLVGNARLDKPIAIPLLHQFRRRTPDCPCFRHIEQQRPKTRSGQSVRERVVRTRW